MSYDKALRVNLEKELVEELNDLKKYYAINSDSDFIRFLIRKNFKDLPKGKKQPDSKINPDF